MYNGKLSQFSLSTKEIAASIIFGAAVFAMTRVIQIPVPATGGYGNLGDTMVLTAALLFGRRVGALAGGVGSALADAFSPYAMWAPATLVIKGIEGYLAGYLRSTTQPRRNIFAVVIGAAIMVIGYLIVQIAAFGYGDALAELPVNLFQAAAGITISLLVLKSVLKTAPELIFEEDEV